MAPSPIKALAAMTADRDRLKRVTVSMRLECTAHKKRLMDGERRIRQTALVTFADPEDALRAALAVEKVVKQVATDAVEVADRTANTSRSLADQSAMYSKDARRGWTDGDAAAKLCDMAEAAAVEAEGAQQCANTVKAVLVDAEAIILEIQKGMVATPIFENGKLSPQDALNVAIVAANQAAMRSTIANDALKDAKAVLAKARLKLKTQKGMTK